MLLVVELSWAVPRRRCKARPGSVVRSHFSELFDRCMSPSQRVAHVSDSAARLLHAVMSSCGSMHGAVIHDDSFGVHVNSRGVVGHKNSCNSHAAEFREETKALSTSTRCKVGRRAGIELAPLQQASEKVACRDVVADRVLA